MGWLRWLRRFRRLGRAVWEVVVDGVAWLDGLDGVVRAVLQSCYL